MRNSLQKLLIIGFVWPEPKSSAAGGRMMELITFFQFLNYEITFASAASDSEYAFDVTDIGVSKKSIELNSDSFDLFVQQLNPTIVLFDRFMTEEQFGWRVAENCPTALRILDTEDLHFLRAARQLAFKEKREFHFSDLNSDIAKREIASIYRCDLTLIISEFEMELLENHFKIDQSLLFYLPFLLPSLEINHVHKCKSFEERKNIVFIGNFYHEPNWNAVLYLKEKIWPLLSKLNSLVELHVYGAYSSQKVMNLNNPKERFYCLGRAESSEEVISNARILLAPLRFGAGLKGKLIEAMVCGTPSVTTSIGAEGMNGFLDWPGIISNNPEEIANLTQKLYEDKEFWVTSQEYGFEIVNDRFNEEEFKRLLTVKITYLLENIELHRSCNFIGQMLLHHTLASTKYMSKWITEKNNGRGGLAKS